MLEYLQKIMTQPMVEATFQDELVGVLFIGFCIGFVALFGYLTYKLEERWGKNGKNKK